jgi:uncharacterized protein YgiM (DUF1202 family)
MNRSLLKFSLVCVAGVFVLVSNPKTAMAYEQALAGFTYDKMSDSKESNPTGDIVSTLSANDAAIPGYTNLAIANVSNNLNIRSGAGEDYKLVGKLPKNGGCEIITADNEGWTKIKSNGITGYVNSDYLITGTEAVQLAKEVGFYVAEANTNGLRVRKSSNTDAEVVDQIAKGEELLVVNSKVITDNPAYPVWVEVSLDSDDSEEGTTAYVAKDFVDISFKLIDAVSIEALEFGTGVSNSRINLVNEAKEHLGESYVWGGTRLGSGVDCSGFTQAIYRVMGYTISRTSRSQAVGGTKISASQLKPGDLVFYGSSSYISHVAIYIGNGKIIHASNRRDGIKISNMYYRQPVKYVRYIND